MPRVIAHTRNRLPAGLCQFGLGGLLLAVDGLARMAAAAPGLFDTGAVIANPVPAPPLTTEWQQDQPDEMDVFLPAGEAEENELPEIFRYGPLQLRPHADYRIFYGNGIQSSPGNAESMLIQDLSPGLLLDLGSHWALDYTPTFRFYSSDKFRDTMDQSVSLTGGFAYEDWKYTLSHSSQFTSDPTVETGTQTTQSTHSTSFGASHALNSQVSADLGLSQQINLVSGLDNSYDWSTMDWLNYEFWPRMNAGLGLGGGYVLVQANGQAQAGNAGDLDQTYEQAQARVNWRATQKISFQINGGLEDRQFMTAGTRAALNPIFGAAIQYAPFKVTQISLNASRAVSASDYYLAAQETETTTVSLNLDQRVLKKFKLDLGVAYSQSDYGTATGGAAGNAVNRTDDEISLTARLSHPFFRRGTWSLFYQYSDNNSSQPGFSFTSSQTGFEVGYRF